MVLKYHCINTELPWKFFRFWIGVSEDVCKKFPGTHWEMKVNACGKKVYAAITCCELPEFNMCGVYTEGKEHEIPGPLGLVSCHM